MFEICFSHKYHAKKKGTSKAILRESFAERLVFLELLQLSTSGVIRLNANDYGIHTEHDLSHQGHQVVESASKVRSASSGILPHTIFIHWTESWPDSRDCTNVVFALQWLFFPKCDFYGSHKQKQQALFDLFKKKKTTSNTSQPAFERNHLGAKGKISASQELRWWGWTRLCWPHAAASCVEATSRLKWMKFRGFLVLRVGGYGWLRLIFPGIGIHFHWVFRKRIVDNQPQSPKSSRPKGFKLSSVSLQLSPTLSSKTRPGSFHPGLCMQLLKSWR